MTTTPRRLGKYELRQLLGHGSAGEVWQGYDLQRRQDVAVKLLHPDLLQSDPNFILHFLKEWQYIIALSHPNIVQVRDANVTRSNETRVTTPYIVMDYIEGHSTLADAISRTSRAGSFPAVTDLVRIFTNIGAAVDYAHEQRIFHDDIKPSNILLDKDNIEHLTMGEPKLTDFGIARLPGNETMLSPLYMSPEQVIGRQSNSRSDIYALGVMLYEMCTGVLPFHGESNVAVMMHHLNTLPTPPMLINPNIPPGLSEVILRALAKDPNDRFASASLLASALAEACAVAQDPQLLNKKVQDVGERPLYYMSTGPLPHAAQAVGNMPPILGVAQPVPPLSAKIPAMQRQRITFPFNERAPLQSNSTVSTGQGYKVPMQATRMPSMLPELPAVPMTNGDTSLPRSATSPWQSQGSGKIYTPPPITSTELPIAPVATRTGRGKKASVSAFLSPLSLIICLLLLLIVIGTLTTSLLLHHAVVATPKAVVGHVFLQDDALGHDDTLSIEMQGIAAPGVGKDYFAWLQQSTGQVMPLGSLVVHNGSASLLYNGDTQHTNLLATMKSVFVTQEESGQSSPTTFTNNAKIYQASFAANLLPSIQRILYDLPSFPERGGLSAGLFTTVQGMSDKAASIVDSLQGKPMDDALALRQATRIIELIDGTQFARTSGDLPKLLPSMLSIPVGLISSPTQQGYIDTLVTQIEQLKQVAGGNSELLRHIQNVDNALTDLQNWVATMRGYDRQILSATSLNKPAMLNVALQLKQLVQDTYMGRIVPPNDSPLPVLGSAGATQLYAECQYLAEMDMKQA